MPARSPRWRRTRIRSAALALERPAARELDDYYFGRAIAELTGSEPLSHQRSEDARAVRGRQRWLGSWWPVPRPRAWPRCGADLPPARPLIESARLLRNLGNLPANVCTPRYLANQARELERSYRRRLRVRIFDEAGIRRLNMGCLLAVTRGSEEPPRFIVLEYRGGRRGRAPVVLVGKGVTFDTGGISLKDPPAMDEMKFDMCGAATVLAAIDFAARAELKINLVGWCRRARTCPMAAPSSLATSSPAPRDRLSRSSIPMPKAG